MADRVGQQLGNYRLIQLLGQGGFAQVYLHRPDLFNAVTRAWLTDQPLPPGLIPLR